MVLKVGFEVFLDCSLDLIGLKAIRLSPSFEPFRKHLLVRLEPVFHVSADPLLKRWRVASAAQDGDCSAAKNRH